MMLNKEQIKALESRIKEYKITRKEDLDTFKNKFIHKKGIISSLFTQLKKLPLEEKKQMGCLVNELKKQAETKYDNLKKKLTSTSSYTDYPTQEDITLPPIPKHPGTLHPITHIKQKVISILKQIGFEQVEGCEMVGDKVNFELLNFPADHPAREMQDTFFLASPTQAKSLLRTHTSSVQVPIMQGTPPPIKVLSEGKVFRRETISARTHCFFHQLEALYINKNVSFIDLRTTIHHLLHQFFNPHIKIRFRPSYFPFTEPSAEVDIHCLNCQAKGCPVCKYTSWVEIMGAGMIDPNVLTNCNIDPNTYSGFALGLGIERLTMLYYQIPDIRLFTQNHLPFLQQFVQKP